MSNFYNDTMHSLEQAIEIEKGNVPLTERKCMAAPTYYVEEEDSVKFDDLLQEQLKNPEFKKEWDAIQPEMNAIKRSIKKRNKRELRRQRKRRRERMEINKRLK